MPNPGICRRFVVSVPEQVSQAQGFGQRFQGQQVRCVGPRQPLFPAPHGLDVGAHPPGDLRPGQIRLLLEPLQPLREVGGENAGDSAVGYAASSALLASSTGIIWDAP